MSTISYENKTLQQAGVNNATEEYWPKEKYFQIKLINKKHQKQKQLQQAADEEEWQLPAKYVLHTSTHRHYHYQQLQQEQLQSQLQLQQECDKTPYECEYNLTMTTTQVANILPANIVTVALVFNILQYICYKETSNAHHYLYAQFCTTSPKNFSTNSLNTAATCRNTRTATGNSTSNNFFLTVAKQTKTTATITT